MNNKRYGIQLGDDGDMMVKNGHLSLGETMPQNQYMLLMANKGELKEEPLQGVGISEMLNDNDVMGWKRKIRDGLKADGMEVRNITLTRDGTLTNIDAQYK